MVEKQLRNINRFVGFWLIRKPAVVFLKVGHSACFSVKLSTCSGKGLQKAMPGALACRRQQGSWASRPCHYRLPKKPLWHWEGRSSVLSCSIWWWQMPQVYWVPDLQSAISAKCVWLPVLSGKKKKKVSLTLSVYWLWIEMLLLSISTVFYLFLSWLKQYSS